MRDSTLVRLNPRPETAYINQGRTVLATASNGFVEAHPDHGLFVHQTRLVSRLRWLVDGEPPVPNAMSNLEHDSWLGYYLLEAPGVPPPPRDTGSGQVPGISTQPIELRVSRRVGDGMHEEIEVTNFARERTTFRLTLEIDADFADAAETRGERIQKGKIKREITDDSLTLTYTVSINDRELERALRAVVRDSTTAPRITKSGIDFEIELSPHDSWQAAIDFIAIIEGTELAEGIRQDEKSPAPVKFTAPGSETLTPIVLETLRQAEYDLSALRLHDLDTPRGWTMAAGLPLYIALFGRDTLTSSWQAGLLGPEMMSGTLRRLQELQGSEENDWRDEQPGKMIHEAHDGPLAMLDVNPRRRNYGSITTSGLYSFIVAELWHWTGDESLVRPLLPAALASLQWLERYGDLDGDGFYEYLTRSSEGVRNQGWKDSADAIPYDDGRLVDPPIATCEEQGFVYVAKLHFADVLWWLGERDAAKRIFHEAAELKRRFNERFWMEDEGFYALGLDAQKQPIRSITSNPGHCVATAIVDSDRIVATVDRLFNDDLFSGWGIRTLSTTHPRYNPYSYHLGSVWPVEQGTFALGFMRYGLHERAQQLAKAQFEAASLFDYHRLPELFSGHARDERHPFPGIYPNACSPQAWSASTVFSLLQSILGIYPYAALHLLLVDPHLPAWLPDITIENLRLGKATATIRFWRKKDGSSTYRVLRKRGKLHVVRQPTPWSLTATFGERLRDWLTSLLPGK